MLERWERRVSNELDSVSAGSAPKAPLAKQLGQVTKESVTMAKEMRAWVGKVRDTVAQLSIQDKLRVSLSLIQGLGTGDRLKFYAHLAEVEKVRQDGGIDVRVQPPSSKAFQV